MAKKNVHKTKKGTDVMPLAAVEEKERKPGPESAGQSGDTQGLPDEEDSGGESVLELMEEDQAPEASAVEGVEKAREPNVAPVRTRQVKVDDVPPEYLEPDK